MTADRFLFTGVPTALTLGLHLGVALILLVRWTGPAQVVAAAPALEPVHATLVQADALKPRPAPQKAPSVSKPAPKPKSKSKPKLKPEPAPTTEPPLEPRAVSPEDQIAMDAQHLAMLTRQELDTMMEQAEGTGASVSASLRDIVAATIRAAIINRWTRPPSARNGMMAILSIQLVPTGEVVGVGVVESSGHAAFDRSAMTAVERAGRFPEVAKLDHRLFESNFRRFQLVFKPEDLRY
ncbi:MAG: TonB family protein [Luminiphilus sp.]|nr:TonB family protein [Luminiphilus sp.]